MSRFILGPMRKHIPGHKELTDHSELRVIECPDVVSIPLMAMNSVDLEILVKEGDYVKANQVIALRKDHFYMPLFSSVSGEVVEFKDLPHSWGPKKVKHIVIKNDHQYTSVELTPKDYTPMSKEEIVNHIKEMGIIGCGGAGFPTYVKYASMNETEILIINAVECEPYLTGDYHMITHYLDEIVMGVEILIKAANAKKVYFAIKEDKKTAITQLKEAFKHLTNVEIKPVPNVYPMGWERTLVHELTGKYYDKLPSELGVIVNNATTARMVCKAFKEGLPITEKIFTVSGDGVKQPSNCIAKVGTPIAKILEACGGVTQEEVHVIHGGPMMGKTMLSDDVRVNPTTNSLTVLQERKIDPIGCLRCSACVDHCPAGLLPVQIQQAEASKNLDLIAKLDTMSCIECGLCTYVCPSKIDVTENVRRAKLALRLRKGA